MSVYVGVSAQLLIYSGGFVILYPFLLRRFHPTCTTSHPERSKKTDILLVEQCYLYSSSLGVNDKSVLSVVLIKISLFLNNISVTSPPETLSVHYGLFFYRPHSRNHHRGRCLSPRTSSPSCRPPLPAAQPEPQEAPTELLTSIAGCAGGERHRMSGWFKSITGCAVTVWCISSSVVICVVLYNYWSGVGFS